MERNQMSKYPEGPEYLGSYQPVKSSDPIRCLCDKDMEGWENFCRYDHPGWYFWGETWEYLHGPFGTIEECKAALKNYAKNL
jgi:hypothetical protein